MTASADRIRASRRQRVLHMRRIADGLAVVGLLIAMVAAWFVLVHLLDISPVVLPPPEDVGASLVANAGLIWDASLITLVEALAGFVIAVIVGVGLAVIIAYSRVGRLLLVPLLAAFNAAPKVAIAPLLIIWLGLDLPSKVGMAFLLSFFPIVINSTRGLSDVPPEMIDLYRLLKASERETFLKVRLPHALPAMFDGLKIALPIAVVGAVVGEFVASRQGIGYQIILAYSNFDTGLVFAAVISIAVLATLVFEILVLVERRLLRWHAVETGRGS